MKYRIKRVPHNMCDAYIPQIRLVPSQPWKDIHKGFLLMDLAKEFIDNHGKKNTNTFYTYYEPKRS
jgi:hypothetical protein